MSYCFITNNIKKFKHYTVWSCQLLNFLLNASLCRSNLLTSSLYNIYDMAALYALCIGTRTYRYNFAWICFLKMPYASYCYLMLVDKSSLFLMRWARAFSARHALFRLTNGFSNYVLSDSATLCYVWSAAIRYSFFMVNWYCAIQLRFWLLAISAMGLKKSECPTFVKSYLCNVICCWILHLVA